MICDLCYHEFDGRRARRINGERMCVECGDFHRWYQSMTPEDRVKYHRMCDEYEGGGV